MHNLKDLIIWQKAIELASEVYKLTAHFPNEEKFCLTSQIRRSAVSIPSNIAEGAGRNTNKGFAHFLSISNGSSYELQTQLILAQLFGLINENSNTQVLDLLDEIQKINYIFQNNLRQG